jgi:hypothetical protein
VAFAPNPEQSAKLILAIFKDHNVPAEADMRWDQLRFWFLSRGGSQGNLQAGLQAALDHGLVKVEPHDMILLTRRGFEKFERD